MVRKIKQCRSTNINFAFILCKGIEAKTKATCLRSQNQEIGRSGSLTSEPVLLTTIIPELCSNSQPKETKISTNIFSFHLSWVLFITNLIIFWIPIEILFEFFDPEWLIPKPMKGLASEKNYLTLQYSISIVFKNTISVLLIHILFASN